MKRAERTAQLFEDEGLYCAQSILAVFGEPFGIAPDRAKCLGRPLCGAIASHAWGTCGYVMGGVIALAHSRDKTDEELAREDTKTAVFEFLRRVEAQLGSIACKDFLGADMSTPEGKEKIQDEKLVAKKCPRLGREIAEILSQVISSDAPD